MQRDLKTLNSLLSLSIANICKSVKENEYCYWMLSFKIFCILKSCSKSSPKNAKNTLSSFLYIPAAHT